MLQQFKTAYRCLAVIVMTGIMVGCQQYGEVSPRAYEVANALYAVCNQKDETRLTKVESVIDESLEASQLTDAEAEWLRAIIKTARSGEWSVAMKDARTMLAEQIQ